MKNWDFLFSLCLNTQQWEFGPQKNMTYFICSTINMMMSLFKQHKISLVSLPTLSKCVIGLIVCMCACVLINQEKQHRVVFSSLLCDLLKEQRMCKYNNFASLLKMLLIILSSLNELPLITLIFKLPIEWSSQKILVHTVFVYLIINWCCWWKRGRAEWKQNERWERSLCHKETRRERNACQENLC